MNEIKKLRVLALPKPPFLYQDSSKNIFYGFLIDLLDEITKRLDLPYEIKLQEDLLYGFMDDHGNWNGIMKELKDGNADVGLAAFSIMSERRRVVDFTEPVYKSTGISVLMRKPSPQTDIFRFVTILDPEVWLCIIGSYLFTSVLLWIYDIWSPFSYRNSKKKEPGSRERIFTLKESLWFCLTSLTPQGGGEAPRNLSGRLVAATWWLFGFIIVASYTANLAAYLTIKKFEKEIESFDDLISQYRYTYSFVENSSTHMYFERMNGVEYQLYEKWKDMTLNDSLGIYERAQLAVWEYPLSDKFIKIFSAVKNRKMLGNFTEGIEKLKMNDSKFALITEASDVKYQVMTDCTFREIGPEFSKKPYGLALQKDSALTKRFNNVIYDLERSGWFDKMQDKWWKFNPEKKTKCYDIDNSNGLIIENIAGLFYMIAIGISIALLIFIYEFFYYTFSHEKVKSFYERKFKSRKTKKRNDVIRVFVNNA